MKKTLPLLLCISLIACQENQTHPTQSIQTNACAEELKLSDDVVSNIKKINEAATTPTKKEVIFLARFLLEESVRQNFDHGSCQGFYEKVRSATLRTLENRAIEIRPILQEIIDEPYLGSGRDLMAQAAMNESKDAAQRALKFLDGH
jgi:hypothetical protein